MSRAVDADAEIERDWLAGYDDPVVRPSGSDKKKMHEPDEDADEPQPNCDVAGRDDTDWIVSERAALEPFYSVCGKPTCQDGLAQPLATADQDIIVAASGECAATEAELVETFHEAESNRAQAHVLNALAEVRRGDGE